MAQDDVKRTGVIGLGAMGLQMARHMVLKGFKVSGYDVSADAAKKAEGHGVRICASVTDTGKDADVVFVMVANDEQIHDVIERSGLIGGIVTALDDGNGRCLVGSAMGPLRVQASQGVTKDIAVTVSVRPEDVELSESPPPAAAGDNVCKAVVTAKDFLGEHLDFQVKVGEVVLLARAHPSLRTPVGDSIYLRMKAEKCVAIPTPAATPTATTPNDPTPAVAAPMAPAGADR
jgi:NAD binding domain of 6-phosphogluconate dehydrogenase/TOBE domain